jgi:rubrerythrin
MSSSSDQGDMSQGDMSQGDMSQGDMSQGDMSQSTSGTMSAQGQVTDPSQNLQYDLISTLYHACKSNTAIEQYIRDAQKLGNNEAAQFFQMVAQQDLQRAARAQELLNQLGGTLGTTTAH